MIFVPSSSVNVIVVALAFLVPSVSYCLTLLYVIWLPLKSFTTAVYVYGFSGEYASSNKPTISDDIVNNTKSTSNTYIMMNELTAMINRMIPIMNMIITSFLYYRNAPVYLNRCVNKLIFGYKNGPKIVATVSATNRIAPMTASTLQILASTFLRSSAAALS